MTDELDRDRCGNCIGFEGDRLNSGLCYRVVDGKYVLPHNGLDDGNNVSSDDKCTHFERKEL